MSKTECCGSIDNNDLLIIDIWLIITHYAVFITWGLRYAVLLCVINHFKINKSELRVFFYPIADNDYNSGVCSGPNLTQHMSMYGRRSLWTGSIEQDLFTMQMQSGTGRKTVQFRNLLRITLEINLIFLRKLILIPTYWAATTSTSSSNSRTIIFSNSAFSLPDGAEFRVPILLPLREA